MSVINTEMKPFKAEAYKDGKFVTVSEADVAGKWGVFFFYPADFTFVCPTELEDLAENYDAFQAMGVEIFSVSTDTHFSHKAWHDTSDAIGKIKFAMVGDPTGTITRNFDVMREGQGLADRGTFVVDPDGVIQIMEITSEGVGRNAEELLRKVKAAQYVRAHPDEVCPAKWEEGEETLAPSLQLVGKI
ncbi:MAG: peroxiredoxin [Rhodospirillaceae bacterium]|nr:peroxiredoxin [Rhodospirillaceae bacterium]